MDLRNLLWNRRADVLHAAKFAGTVLAKVLPRLPEADLVGPARIIGITELTAVVLPEADLADTEGVPGRLFEGEMTATWAGEAPAERGASGGQVIDRLPEPRPRGAQGGPVRFQERGSSVREDTAFGRASALVIVKVDRPVLRAGIENGANLPPVGQEMGAFRRARHGDWGQPIATMRSIGSLARSAISAGTLTSNFISARESRSFGRVIIFMYLQ